MSGIAAGKRQAPAISWGFFIYNAEDKNQHHAHQNGELQFPVRRHVMHHLHTFDTAPEMSPKIVPDIGGQFSE